MTSTAAWLLNPGQTRQMTRQVPATPITPIDAMTSRTGVIPGGTPFNLTGTGMTGTLGVGRAYIQGTTAQGGYPVAITAAETITVANGHATLPRIDSIFLVVYDQLFDTSGQTLTSVVYVQGTAATTPTAPAAPTTTNAALRLWDITVPAGASAGSPINWGTALTDRRLYVVAAGGIGVGASGNGAYVGQYRDPGAGIQRWDGSSWVNTLMLDTAGKFVVGVDTEWSRGGANQWTTPDSVSIGGNLAVSGIGQKQFLNVAADLPVTGTTSIDATGMAATVAANCVYEVRGMLGASGSTTGDLKISWVAPAGATFNWVPLTQPSTASVTVGTVITDRSSIGTSQAIGTIGAGASMTATIMGKLAVSSTGGTFKLQIAQGTLDSGTPSKLMADSYLIVERVA